MRCNSRNSKISKPVWLWWWAARWKCIKMSVWVSALAYSVGCTVVWPQWWSFEDKGQLGVEFLLKNQFKKSIFWFNFYWFSNTIFLWIVSVETILFWIQPYELWPLVTAHTGSETIQGRKLFAEIWNVILENNVFQKLISSKMSIQFFS